MCKPHHALLALAPSWQTIKKQERGCGGAEVVNKRLKLATVLRISLLDSTHRSALNGW
jgi:hypothetical protein